MRALNSEMYLSQYMRLNSIYRKMTIPYKLLRSGNMQGMVRHRSRFGLQALPKS